MRVLRGHRFSDHRCGLMHTVALLEDVQDGAFIEFRTVSPGPRGHLTDGPQSKLRIHFDSVPTEPSRAQDLDLRRYPVTREILRVLGRDRPRFR